MPAPVQGDLGAARKYLEKQFGKGSLMNLSGSVELHKCIPTGHPFIDYVMGGGMPYGKMVEIYGQPSSGKTTLSLLIAAQAQRIHNNTGRVLWLDYEHAFDLRYFKRLGGLFDEDHFLVSQPSTAEEGLEIARIFVARELCDLVVFDSVAAMMSFKESGDWVDSSGNVTTDGKGKQQGGMGTTQIGLHARVITQGIKQLQAKIGPPEIGVIWINQIRTKIATGKGQQTRETTTGGNAIKFYSGIRLEMQRVSSKKGKLYDPIENKILDDQVVAINTRVKGAKNRCAPPFRQAVVTCTFGQGLDTETDLLKMATNHKLVSKGKTGWYSTKDIGATRNARGEADFKKLLREEPEIKAGLMIKVQDLLAKLSDLGMTVVDEEEAELERTDEILAIQPSFVGEASIQKDMQIIDITKEQTDPAVTTELDSLLETAESMPEQDLRAPVDFSSKKIAEFTEAARKTIDPSPDNLAIDTISRLPGYQE